MGVAGGTCVLRRLVLCARAGFVRALACVVKAGWCVHVTCRSGVFLSRGGVGEEGWGVCREACACESGMCTYVNTREETGGNVQVGWWARGKGVCVCAGEDEANKELCGQTGQTPGPSPGCWGWRKPGEPCPGLHAGSPGKDSAVWPVPCAREGWEGGDAMRVRAKAGAFVQEKGWDVSERRLSVTLGVRHFFFLGHLGPPAGVGLNRGASPRAATARGGQAPAVGGSVFIAAAVKVKKIK